MKFQKRNTPNSLPLNNDSVAPSCPLLNIPKIDEHGMVLESQCGFDVGSTIALGFHLQCADTVSEQTPQGPSSPQYSTFINVEAIVVESKMGSSSVGRPVHLVTVLFSLIKRKDREQLLRYSARPSAHSQPKSSLTAHHASASSDYNEKLRREVTQRIHLN